MSAESIEFEHMDLIDFAVKQGNGVNGLSKLGLKSIPHRYILPPEERLNQNQVVLEDSIPIIDVSNWGDPEAAALICEAAAKWGFFQIINHGVPLEVLEDVLEAGHKFFELPNEERRKYLKENSPTPTVQLKTGFSPLAEKVFEWKDYLVHHYVPHNVSSDLWPSVSKDQVLEYLKWAKPVIKKLVEVLLQGLNVKELDESQESQLIDRTTISLIHYPMCPSPELACGARRHSDISSITILLQDDVGGLYVKGTTADQWIHVSPVKGALAVNIGDILQIVSNDRYKSIEHQVIVNGRRNRVSVPIFVSPAADTVVGPFPQSLENGKKPIYKHVIYSDYLNYFLSKRDDRNQTIEFAKI
nr:feruloyl CoA ortho-hydroxylase 1-like [Coffea arabica]